MFHEKRKASAPAWDQAARARCFLRDAARSCDNKAGRRPFFIVLSSLLLSKPGKPEKLNLAVKDRRQHHDLALPPARK
jgi:hypothetical protein